MVKRPETERLTRVFQDRVVAAIEASFTAAAEDEKIRRRMLQQLGTPRAAEELVAFKCALKGRDVLASLSARQGVWSGICRFARQGCGSCRTPEIKAARA